MVHEPYTMYGSLMSYYSGKIRSYLRKKRLIFRERLPNDAHFFKHVAPKVGGQYQPTLVTPEGDVLRDTSVIIDALEARHQDFPVFPTSPVQRTIALLFEFFGDEALLKPAMHYRWVDPDNRTKWIVPANSDDYVARWFHKFTDPFSELSAHEQAQVRMNRIIEVTLPGLGISPDTAPAIEASFMEFLNLFERHLQDYPYLLGGKPSIGDFGLMGPLYAHLGRDPVPSKLIKTEAPAVFDWIERMNGPEDGLFFHPDIRPEFLPGDEIPETLFPIIELMARDFMPEVESLIRFMNDRTNTFGRAAPGSPVSTRRILSLGVVDPIGYHDVQLRGKTLHLAIRHYMQWMYQRVQDSYMKLASSDRQDLDRKLETVGMKQLLELRITQRIERINNIEVFI